MAGPWCSPAHSSNRLYAAKDVEARFEPKSLAKSEGYMNQGYDSKSKQFRTDDSVGVALYRAAERCGHGRASISGKTLE